MIRTPILRGTAVLGLALGLAACSGPEPSAQRAAAPAAAPAHSPATAPTVDMAKARAAAMGNSPLQALDLGAAGSRTVQGRIAGDKAPAYAVALAAGQTLHVTMTSRINAATFNVNDAANPGTAVHRGSVEGNTAAIKAAQATTYVIVPFTERAVARRGTITPFTLTVKRD